MSRPLTLRVSVELRLLVLIGGGDFSSGATRAIDEFLLENLAPGKNTIAFLPTASGSAEYATHIGAHFQKIVPSVVTTNVPVYRGRDSRRQKSLDTIKSAGMVYLGGGVTNNLAETIVGSPTDGAMREAAAAGALVAAIGASASAFGSHMRDMRGAGGAMPGLHWLAATVVEPSFDRDNDVGLRRLMSLPEVEVGIGLPAGTALGIRGDGSTEIIGSGSIAVFRKG
jgi:cyanophycinase-like exopeptidase